MHFFRHFFKMASMNGKPKVAALLGMPDAAARLGVSADSARRALLNAGAPLVRINGKAWAIEEGDLLAFIENRASYKGRGRPKGAKGKKDT